MLTRLTFAGIILCVPLTGLSAITNEPEVLLLDELGRVVKLSTNAVARELHPLEANWSKQIPTPIKGAPRPDEVQERIQLAPQEFEWFPAHQPHLMPYLASQDELGNTVAKPGALFPLFPLEGPVQQTKYWLSEHGLNYSLQQTLTFATMTGVAKGDNNLGYYTFDFQGKWAAFNAPAEGTAGWVSTHIEAKSGLGSSGQKEDARRNIDSITDPTGIWSSVNGLRIPELAWQQSLRDGEVVVVAGMVNQGDYLDQNAYAQSGRSHFINSALISSQVLPLPNYNFGVNLQWQPVREWYAMLGTSAGENTAGFAPWTDFSLDTCSLVGEFGYMPSDVLGLGPGVYRVQPFVAKSEGSSGGGIGFNLQQKLGHHTPFGWFGRFGVGGEDVSSDAAAQIGTGIVWHGPLQHLATGRLSNDLLGAGVVWSQPASTSKAIYHRNEYIFETFYALQLSPTAKLMPDFQYVRNPAFNAKHDESLVFQIQLVLGW